jgi:hypothetical protein
MKTEPWGMKVRLITDITSTALRKEEIVASLKEGALQHVDSLGNDCEVTKYTTAVTE